MWQKQPGLGDRPSSSLPWEVGGECRPVPRLLGWPGGKSECKPQSHQHEGGRPAVSDSAALGFPEPSLLWANRFLAPTVISHTGESQTTWMRCKRCEKNQRPLNFLGSPTACNAQPAFLAAVERWPASTPHETQKSRIRLSSART